MHTTVSAPGILTIGLDDGVVISIANWELGQRFNQEIRYEDGLVITNARFADWLYYISSDGSLTRLAPLAGRQDSDEPGMYHVSFKPFRENSLLVVYDQGLIRVDSGPIATHVWESPFPIVCNEFVSHTDDVATIDLNGRRVVIDLETGDELN